MTVGEPEVSVSMQVNGVHVAGDVEPRRLLVHFLRDLAGTSSVRVGCDTTSCGACTVLLDGQAVKSCTLFAVQADGRSVTTVEGLSRDDEPLHPLQEAFRREHALQCGYCTAGIVLAAHNLVAEATGELSDDDVREAISGNICRCTGYVNIVKAIQAAARETVADRTSSA